MKHIYVHHHLIQEQVELSTFKILYIPTAKMLADNLTKPLSHVRLEQMVKELVLVTI
jgi:hypothetical protein